MWENGVYRALCPDACFRSVASCARDLRRNRAIRNVASVTFAISDAARNARKPGAVCAVTRKGPTDTSGSLKLCALGTRVCVMVTSASRSERADPRTSARTEPSSGALPLSMSNTLADAPGKGRSSAASSLRARVMTTRAPLTPASAVSAPASWCSSARSSACSRSCASGTRRASGDSPASAGSARAAVASMSSAAASAKRAITCRT